MTGSRSMTQILRAPEPGLQRRLADRVALSRAGISGRATGAADPEVTLLIAKYIATRTGGKLRPASLEGPTGCRRRSRMCYWSSHIWDEKQREKN